MNYNNKIDYKMNNNKINIKYNNRLAMANGYAKKDLKNAERTAFFIRRMEYATSMKRQMKDDKKMKNDNKNIILIQIWWKTMYKIIKLQKNIRGFLFRKKLMKNLEHQETLLQFIKKFDDIYGCHLCRNFMDNLKKKRDFEKAKLMEKCEDFNERLDNNEYYNKINYKFEKDPNNLKNKYDITNTNDNWGCNDIFEVFISYKDNKEYIISKNINYNLDIFTLLDNQKIKSLNGHKNRIAIVRYFINNKNYNEYLISADEEHLVIKWDIINNYNIKY